jgi:hypothetical protein
MKKRNFIFTVLFFVTTSAWAQIHLMPFVGINSTKLLLGDEYQNGGNYIFGGVEVQGRLKAKKISAWHVSVVTGASYLSNGYYNNNLFSFPGVSFYSAKLTDLSTQYVQVPLTIRLNWQPFPLVEEFQVFFGAGVVDNFLLKAHLTEKTTSVTFSTDIFAPPLTAHYEDSRDVTDLAAKQSLFSRFEFGFRFKHVQVSYRLSRSLNDMYLTGLENVWKIPASSSAYISGHDTAGSTKAKYSELTIGYRIF